MKSIKRSIGPVIVLLCLYSCLKPRPDVKFDKTAKVQAAVDKVRLALSDSLGIAFPSLNVLIQTPTDKIFVSSVGGFQQKVTADTYFRFASNTKNFTAAAILNMYEDGWLDYKARITDNIPGAKGMPYIPAGDDWDIPHKKEITIEQLLQHAAGVFDVDNDPVPGYNGKSYTEFIQSLDPGHQFTTEEMVKVIVANKLSYFPPGKDYHYSNTGYSMLAEIIKRVYTFRAGTNKNYNDYMQDYAVGNFTPVPVKIYFPVLATDVSMPDPHLKGTILSVGGPLTYDTYNMSAQVGEGNGYGTMEQLNLRIRTLMKGQNILKPATVALMQKDVSQGNATYGLGCSYVKNIGYGHTGARIGYLSLMAYDPVTDVSVISMINLYDFRQGATSFMKCYDAIYDAAYGAREALGFPGKP